jgi:hypothetical protein
MLHRALFPAVLAVALGAQAQAPVITFDKTHQDLGRISPDRKTSVRFKVSNTGNAPLQITAVNPSCGCTSTVLGNWYLKPGESSDIEAVLDPHGMKGPIRKSMTVVSDDPKNPGALLTFEAEVVQEVMTSVDAVFFSMASRTASQTTKVKVSSGVGEEIRILEAKAPGAPFLKLSSHAEGKDSVLDVVLDGPKIPANLKFGSEQITLRTSSAKMPTLTLPVNWSLRPTFQIDPVRVSWDNAKAGTELTKTVVLKQIENRPFRILGVKPSRDLLRAAWQGGAAAPQQSLTVSLSKDAKPGRYAEQILVETDDPEEKEVALRVSVTLE